MSRDRKLALLGLGMGAAGIALGFLSEPLGVPLPIMIGIGVAGAYLAFRLIDR